MDHLTDKIRDCPTLPALPAVALRVLELAQRADATADEIAAAIAADPALAGRILRTVNSSYYCRGQPVETVAQAVEQLGLHTVRSLVLGYSLADLLAKSCYSALDGDRHWRRSIYAATAARVIAHRVDFLHVEEAFLAALLMDIGMLVLDRVLAHDYAGVLKQVAAHADLPRAEHAALGLTHATAGKILTERWQLPPLLSIPIEYHHAPEGTDDATLMRLAQILSLSATCADVFVTPDPSAAVAGVRALWADEFGLGPDDADALLDEVGRRTVESAALLDIDLPDPADYRAILSRLAPAA